MRKRLAAAEEAVQVLRQMAAVNRAARATDNLPTQRTATSALGTGVIPMTVFLVSGARSDYLRRRWRRATRTIERLAEWHEAAPVDVRAAVRKAAFGHHLAAAVVYDGAVTVRHRVESVLVLRAEHVCSRVHLSGQDTR